MKRFLISLQSLLFVSLASLTPGAQAEQKMQVVEHFDPQFGMIAMRTLVPADWKPPTNPIRPNRDNKVVAESASGLIIYETQTRSSVIPSGDPLLDRISAQNGALLEQYQPLPQLMQRLTGAYAQKKGFTYITGYRVDALLNFHRQELVNSRWYTQHFDTWATEWDMGNGNHGVLMAVQAVGKPTRYTLSNSASGRATALNTVTFRFIEAPRAIIHQARDQFIASIANIEINAVWHQRRQQRHLAIMSGTEQAGKAAMARSAQAHNARMSAIDTQAKVGKTYSDILDISHAGYMSRSNVQYGGHQKSIRGIHDRTVIQGSNGGQFSVRAGSKHYWVNSATGQYLGTDNPNFDPRVNTELTGQWEQFQIQR